jgi:hypothetical protein
MQANPSRPNINSEPITKHVNRQSYPVIFGHDELIIAFQFVFKPNAATDRKKMLEAALVSRFGPITVNANTFYLWCSDANVSMYLSNFYYAPEKIINEHIYLYFSYF